MSARRAAPIMIEESPATIPVYHWGRDEGIISTPRINKLELRFFAFSIAWEEAHYTATKDDIEKRTEELHNDMVVKGNTYCAELIRYIILDQLQLHSITTVKARSQAAILHDFNHIWEVTDGHPNRASRSPAQYLNHLAVRNGRVPGKFCIHVPRTKITRSISVHPAESKKEKKA